MTRAEIEALLPFLANGSLDGEEREAVEQAVAEDEELRTELQALRAIRETMQAEEAFSPGEVGLARLMKDVEASTPTAANTNARPRFWQIAAAVLLAVVLGQGAYMMRGTDPGGFELAGGETAMTVAFAPTTSEELLRTLLLDAGVETVGGPSALGLYQIGLLDGVTLDQARAALDASALVESLEVPEE